MSLKLAAMEAIVTLFNANSGSDFYLAVAGRLRHGQALQAEASPYAVFFCYDANPEYYFDVETYESLFVQFSVFSQSPDATEVLQTADQLMDLFDDCALTVTGYTHHHFERERDGSIPPDPAESDEEIWQQHVVEYLLTFEKN